MVSGSGDIGLYIHRPAGMPPSESLSSLQVQSSKMELDLGHGCSILLALTA